MPDYAQFCRCCPIWCSKKGDKLTNDLSSGYSIKACLVFCWTAALDVTMSIARFYIRSRRAKIDPTCESERACHVSHLSLSPCDKTKSIDVIKSGFRRALSRWLEWLDCEYLTWLEVSTCVALTFRILWNPLNRLGGAKSLHLRQTVGPDMASEWSTKPLSTVKMKYSCCHCTASLLNMYVQIYIYIYIYTCERAMLRLTPWQLRRV